MGNLPHIGSEQDDEYNLPPAWEALLGDFTFSTPYDKDFVTRAVAWTFAATSTMSSASSPSAVQPVVWAGSTIKRFAVGNATWIQNHAES